MIKLTKLNGETVLVNINQIQIIEMIPESKIVFVNKEYLLVREKADEIVTAIEAFHAKVYGHHRHLTVDRWD